tara:strand:- start:575 stop:772 length:198 start_codon:yes stop_codon:yes gene_type:complete
MTTPEYVNYCIEINDKIREFDYIKEKKPKQKKKIIRKEKRDDKNDFEIISKDEIPRLTTIKERYN